MSDTNNSNDSDTKPETEGEDNVLNLRVDLEISKEETSLDGYFDDIIARNKGLKEKIKAERAKRNEQVTQDYRLKK